MFKRYQSVMVFGSVLLLTASGGMAQIIGEYYTSDTAGQFSKLKDTRMDQKIDFNWGTGAPNTSRVAENLFAIRWTGQLSIPASGDWTFFTETDDGVRLYINGTLLVDRWVDQGATEHSGNIALTEGLADIVMEYYENGGGAVARLRWQGPGTPKAVVPPEAFYTEYGLLARYDRDEDPLRGTPGVYRREAPIDYHWGEMAPFAGFPANNFSARWKGLVEAPGTGQFTFYVTSDDGSELWVNGVRLTNAFAQNHPATEYSGQIDLESGMRYPIDLRYREAGGNAVIQLFWEGPGIPEKQPIPPTALTPDQPFISVERAATLEGQPLRRLEYDEETTMAIVASGGDAPLLYSWQRIPLGGGAPVPVTLPGSDTPELSIVLASDDDGGFYYCEVFDGVELRVSPSFSIYPMSQLPLLSPLSLLMVGAIMAGAGTLALRRQKRRD
jgi:hypothetical protein